MDVGVVNRLHVVDERTVLQGNEICVGLNAGIGDDAPTARRLTELAASAFDAPLPDFVAPGSAPEVEQRAGAFLPYFRVPGVFRTDASSRLGFIAPPLETYFTTLLRYADEARWGRNNRARWTTAPVA